MWMISMSFIRKPILLVYVFLWRRVTQIEVQVKLTWTAKSLWYIQQQEVIFKEKRVSSGLETTNNWESDQNWRAHKEYYSHPKMCRSFCTQLDHEVVCKEDKGDTVTFENWKKGQITSIAIKQGHHNDQSSLLIHAIIEGTQPYKSSLAIRKSSLQQSFTIQSQVQSKQNRDVL